MNGSTCRALFVSTIVAAILSVGVAAAQVPNYDDAVAGCARDVAVYCYNLGVMMAQGEGGPKEMDQARQSAITGCNVGKADSYALAGDLELQQSGFSS